MMKTPLILITLFCIAIRNDHFTSAAFLPSPKSSSLQSHSPIHSKTKPISTPNHATSDGDQTTNSEHHHDHHPLSIGFLGCGTIASAIATGLATFHSPPIRSIIVTKRSERNSKRLAEQFPNLVTISSNDENENDDIQANQKVVDESDIVFICVLPQQMEEVLSKLKFDPEKHVLVSLVSTSNLDELMDASHLPEERVYKMICLPSVATQQGICLVTPPIATPHLKPLFQSLGGCVECETESKLKVLMVSSSLMGPLYRLLQSNRDWLIRHGISKRDASLVVGKQYLGMIMDVEQRRNNCDREEDCCFEDLVEEQTPGGLNEQAIHNLERQGVYEAYNVAMDLILSRLEGTSDGYLSPHEE